jgi:uncharacterized membrane protein
MACRWEAAHGIRTHDLLHGKQRQRKRLLTTRTRIPLADPGFDPCDAAEWLAAAEWRSRRLGLYQVTPERRHDRLDASRSDEAHRIETMTLVAVPIADTAELRRLIEFASDRNPVNRYLTSHQKELPR